MAYPALILGNILKTADHYKKFIMNSKSIFVISLAFVGAINAEPLVTEYPAENVTIVSSDLEVVNGNLDIFSEPGQGGGNLHVYGAKHDIDPTALGILPEQTCASLTARGPIKLFASDLSDKNDFHMIELSAKAIGPRGKKVIIPLGKLASITSNLTIDISMWSGGRGSNSGSAKYLLGGAFIDQELISAEQVGAGARLKLYTTYHGSNNNGKVESNMYLEYTIADKSAGNSSLETNFIIRIISNKDFYVSSRTYGFFPDNNNNGYQSVQLQPRDRYWAPNSGNAGNAGSKPIVSWNRRIEADTITLGGRVVLEDIQGDISMGDFQP